MKRSTKVLDKQVRDFLFAKDTISKSVGARAPLTLVFSCGCEISLVREGEDFMWVVELCFRHEVVQLASEATKGK